MSGRITWKRYTAEDIHWKLIEATAETAKLDAPVSDDGWVAAQALFCPYYVNLEDSLGGDWGVIVNPESVKFGQVVFEHHWCGCPTSLNDHGWYANHGSGSQGSSDWMLPRRKARKS